MYSNRKLIIAILVIMLIGILAFLKADSVLAKQRPDYQEYIKTESVEQWLSDHDRNIIERVVAGEARGESFYGQLAVAQTIHDRAMLSGMNPADIATQPYQYAEPYQGEISESVKLAVVYIFDRGIMIFDEPTTHFYATWIDEPYWTADKVCRGQLGVHRFYF